MLCRFADSLCARSVGLAYEMMNSARSPWKPLICNFPSAYDNFLQMQSPEELERATAERDRAGSAEGGGV